MRTRESDVREALRNNLIDEFKYDLSTKLINEMQVCFGQARVDIAVINGFLHGYEIKSDSDTLERLPQQVYCYSKVFDFVTLVCGEGFLGEIDSIIPRWWGVKVATIDSEGDVAIRVIRDPEENTSIDPLSLVQLLWKDETLSVLASRGLDRGVRSKSKWDIWDKMIQTMDLDDLRQAVREYLKKRECWRADLLQK